MLHFLLDASWLHIKRHHGYTVTSETVFAMIPENKNKCCLGLLVVLSQKVICLTTACCPINSGKCTPRSLWWSNEGAQAVDSVSSLISTQWSSQPSGLCFSAIFINKKELEFVRLHTSVAGANKTVSGIQRARQDTLASSDGLLSHSLPFW